MPASREQVARAIAFFDASSDAALLHQLIEEAAPRAKRAVTNFLRHSGEDAIPPPAEIGPAKDAASQREALETLRTAEDFALLQALTRSIGRRIEVIEIAASADFPRGARVLVPESGRYPAGAAVQPGAVAETGTTLEVLLDSGETWRGPASLAVLSREA